jgi:hypothetical protein
MKRLDELFSQSQKDISDEEFQRIQRQEWYDFCERVLWDISSFTRSFLSSPEFVPRPTAADPAIATVTIDAQQKPYKILKVIRSIRETAPGKKSNGNECTEHSVQAIDNTWRRQVSFPVNNTRLPENTFSVQRYQSEAMQLFFGGEFQIGDITLILKYQTICKMLYAMV